MPPARWWSEARLVVAAAEALVAWRGAMLRRMEPAMSQRVVLPAKLAALLAVASGMVGGCVWSIDLLDRADGDHLRWGFWHNPFQAFEPFSEPFLDVSMWLLLACSAAAGLGGLLLLVGVAWGARLVVWQAPVAIATNGVVVVALALMASGVLAMDWSGAALGLRVGSVLVDLGLWWSLRGGAGRKLVGGKRRG